MSFGCISSRTDNVHVIKIVQNEGYHDELENESVHEMIRYECKENTIDSRFGSTRSVVHENAVPETRIKKDSCLPTLLQNKL